MPKVTANKTGSGRKQGALGHYRYSSSELRGGSTGCRDGRERLPGLSAAKREGSGGAQGCKEHSHLNKKGRGGLAHRNFVAGARQYSSGVRANKGSLVALLASSAGGNGREGEGIK